jgi:two-component system OmpR family response regulator
MNIGLGVKRKTILIIDTDPHARATLRTALEAAAFTVGEAANQHEGERTIKRIKPDAVLADLVIDPIDASGLISSKLKQAGISIPFYVVSSAVDALVGNVDLRELGVSGVFLKPVDSAVVVRTLKTRLDS